MGTKQFIGYTLPDRLAEVLAMVGALQGDLGTLSATVDTEMAGLRTEIGGQITVMKTDLTTLTNGVKTSLEGSVQSVKTSLEGNISSLQTMTNGLSNTVTNELSGIKYVKQSSAPANLQTIYQGSNLDGAVSGDCVGLVLKHWEVPKTGSYYFSVVIGGNFASSGSDLLEFHLSDFTGSCKYGYPAEALPNIAPGTTVAYSYSRGMVVYERKGSGTGSVVLYLKAGDVLSIAKPLASILPSVVVKVGYIE